MKIAEKITDLIGKTPLVKINKLNENGNATIVAKLESFNPAHSIKDSSRIAGENHMIGNVWNCQSSFLS